MATDDDVLVNQRIVSGTTNIPTDTVLPLGGPTAAPPGSFAAAAAAFNSASSQTVSDLLAQAKAYADAASASAASLNALKAEIDQALALATAANNKAGGVISVADLTGVVAANDLRGKLGVSLSAGPADRTKLVALNSVGMIDVSMLPGSASGTGNSIPVLVTSYYSSSDPDHTAAFQKALAASNNVIVPPGHYTVNLSTVDIANGKYIFCLGNPTISSNNSVAIFRMVGSPDAFGRSGIIGPAIIDMTGATVSTTNAIIYGTAAHSMGRVDIVDIEFQNCYGCVAQEQGSFTGSITGSTLTVTACPSNVRIIHNAWISGAGVQPYTFTATQLTSTAPGGALDGTTGTYALSTIAPSPISSTTMNVVNYVYDTCWRRCASIKTRGTQFSLTNTQGEIVTDIRIDNGYNTTPALWTDVSITNCLAGLVVDKIEISGSGSGITTTNSNYSLVLDTFPGAVASIYIRGMILVDSTWKNGVLCRNIDNVRGGVIQSYGNLGIQLNTISCYRWTTMLVCSGASGHMQKAVATSSALPDPTVPGACTSGDQRIATDTGHLWMFTVIDNLWHDRGLQTVATVAALPASGNLVAEEHLVTADGHIYHWDGAEYVDFGLVSPIIKLDTCGNSHLLLTADASNGDGISLVNCTDMTCDVAIDQRPGFTTAGVGLVESGPYSNRNLYRGRFFGAKGSFNVSGAQSRVVNYISNDETFHSGPTNGFVA